MLRLLAFVWMEFLPVLFLVCCQLMSFLLPSALLFNLCVPWQEVHLYTFTTRQLGIMKDDVARIIQAQWTREHCHKGLTEDWKRKKQHIQMPSADQVCEFHFLLKRDEASLSSLFFLLVPPSVLTWQQKSRVYGVIVQLKKAWVLLLVQRWILHRDSDSNTEERDVIINSQNHNHLQATASGLISRRKPALTLIGSPLRTSWMKAVTGILRTRHNILPWPILHFSLFSKCWLC